MEEIWKDIPGMLGHYQVSNTGKIKSVKRTYVGKGGFLRDLPEKIIKTRINKHGYEFLHVGSKVVKLPSQAIHRVVVITFIPNTECKPFVNHIDGEKLNNHVLNLEWCTAKENSEHAWRTGLSKVTKEGVELRRQQFLNPERNPKSRQVLDVETGIYYDSALKAWEAKGKPGNSDHFCRKIHLGRVQFVFI